MIVTLVLTAAAAAEQKPPLAESTISAIIVSGIGAVLTGVFALWLKKARSPADRLAQQVALEEAQAQRAREERERDAAKEQGYREAAEFIKKSAETAIETYKDQTAELRETIQVLTTSLETHQRIKEAERSMSEQERRLNEQTIQRLRDRIVSLEEQVSRLLDLTRAQQLKIDLLEGNPTETVDSLEDGTIPSAQLAHLREALHQTPEAAQ